eukprot:scaffold179373_cov27-Tisochrysis_lutea.AAC.2
MSRRLEKSVKQWRCRQCQSSPSINIWSTNLPIGNGVEDDFACERRDGLFAELSDCRADRFGHRRILERQQPNVGVVPVALGESSLLAPRSPLRRARRRAHRLLLLSGGSAELSRPPIYDELGPRRVEVHLVQLC